MKDFIAIFQAIPSLIGGTLDFIGDLGGILAFSFLWDKYRELIPKVKSKIATPFYPNTGQYHLELHLTFYPGSIPITISSIEVPGFEVSIVSKETSDRQDNLGLLGSFDASYSSGRCSVTWDIPSSADHPGPVYVGLLVSQHNLKFKENVSIPVRLFTNKFIPHKIKHTAVKKKRTSIHQ